MQNSTKISMGNKKRSAFITAHTDEDKKDSLIFNINLSYQIQNNIHVRISKRAMKEYESCFYYAVIHNGYFALEGHLLLQ